MFFSFSIYKSWSRSSSVSFSSLAVFRPLPPSTLPQSLPFLCTIAIYSEGAEL